MSPFELNEENSNSAEKLANQILFADVRRAVSAGIGADIAAGIIFVPLAVYGTCKAMEPESVDGLKEYSTIIVSLLIGFSAVALSLAIGYGVYKALMPDLKVANPSSKPPLMETSITIN